VEETINCMCTGTNCTRVLERVFSPTDRRSKDYQLLLDGVLNGNVNLTCSYFAFVATQFSQIPEPHAAVVTNLHPSLTSLSEARIHIWIHSLFEGSCLLGRSSTYYQTHRIATFVRTVCLINNQSKEFCGPLSVSFVTLYC
jgi:hypothetical protein